MPFTNPVAGFDGELAGSRLTAGRIAFNTSNPQQTEPGYIEVNSPEDSDYGTLWIQCPSVGETSPISPAIKFAGYSEDIGALGGISLDTNSGFITLEARDVKVFDQIAGKQYGVLHNVFYTNTYATVTGPADGSERTIFNGTFNPIPGAYYRFGAQVRLASSVAGDRAFVRIIANGKRLRFGLINLSGGAASENFYIERARWQCPTTWDGSPMNVSLTYGRSIGTGTISYLGFGSDGGVDDDPIELWIDRIG